MASAELQSVDQVMAATGPKTIIPRGRLTTKSVAIGLADLAVAAGVSHPMGILFDRVGGFGPERPPGS